jgi:hypothetical protein
VTVRSAQRYENNLRFSREAKKKRRGVCADCGGETRYNGRNGRVVSERCASCARKRAIAAAVWTRESIVEAIRYYAHLYGRPPGAREWHPAMARRGFRDDLADRFFEDGCWPQYATVARVFGRWNLAIEAAGFAPLKPGHKYVDLEQAAS